MAIIQPAPIPVRGMYFYTRCEHCEWEGSSEQCGTINYGDDADVTCPACHEIFIADEFKPDAAR